LRVVPFDAHLSSPLRRQSSAVAALGASQPSNLYFSSKLRG
jgi:hypothetical protein